MRLWGWKRTSRATGRTDADVFAAARHALDLRPGVPGTVRVHVDQGTATLTGTVQRLTESIEAQDAVERVPGVRAVVNDLAVVPLPDREESEAPAIRG